MEVKSRRDDRCGNPAEAVNEYKKRHIFRSAEFYLYLNHLDDSYCRFDIIEIINNFSNHYEINHIENVFD